MWASANPLSRAYSHCTFDNVKKFRDGGSAKLTVNSAARYVVAVARAGKFAQLASAVGEHSCGQLQREVRLFIISLGERPAAVSEPVALSSEFERRVEQI
jgi:hypothetical protein